MNIKFGMNNFYTRYLKRFLNNELGRSSNILGEFDKSDLELLIQYLKLPNVKDMFECEKYLSEEFPELDNLFIRKLGNDVITYTAKIISTDASNFIMNTISDIRSVCESIGWKVGTVSEWMDTNIDLNNDGKIDLQDRQIIENIITNGQIYEDSIMDKADINRDGKINEEDLDLFNTYMEQNKLKIVIEKSNRQNYFPNEDMLIFINQFTGDFLYGYAIKDENDDLMPHVSKTGLNKIGIYECRPGEKVTIAHNSKDTCHIVIASSSAVLRADITNTNVTNEIEVDLKPGESVQYTCSSREVEGIDAHYLLIQCPSDFSNITGSKTEKLKLDVGDINFDGKIDMLDYHLLARYTAKGPGSEELKWEPTSKQLAVMDVLPDGKITNEDTLRLWRFLNGDPSIPSLGFVYYEHTIPASDDGIKNVSNLLIIEGHYDKNVNIPFDEFRTDGWVVHEKFFNYLLGMAIHKYSDSEQIYYLQKLLKAHYPEHAYDKKFFDPGTYSDLMKQLVFDYQTSKTHYTLGDLDNDGKLTQTDVEMLKTYIEDLNKLDTINKVLNNEITPTGEQINELDYNKNGKIDKEDKSILQKYIKDTYPSTFISRTDINGDNVCDEKDILILQQNVDGKTDSLKQYDNTFNLGWYDVETENELEPEVNMEGLISEVSR